MSAAIGIVRPWPLRTSGEFWGPHYRIVLESGSAYLAVTEGGVLEVGESGAARKITFDIPADENRLLDVGMVRSDLPKELGSSWRLRWVSFCAESPILRTASDESRILSTPWRDLLSGTSTLYSDASGVRAVVYGSFARLASNKVHWVEVARSQVLTIRRNGEWIDIWLAAEDISEEPSQCRREPRDIKLSLVMLATLLVWCLKYVHFWGDHSGSANALPDMSFFNLFHGIVYADWSGHLATAAFVIVHHLRMAVGVEFAGRDSSFFRAKLHAGRRVRESRAWIESLFLALIVSCSVVLTYVVSANDLLWPALLLVAQAALIVLYDLVFWDALVKYDEGRRYNYVVIFGDALFFVATAFILISRVMKGPASVIDLNWGAAVMIVCWLYCGIFLVEVFSAYRLSVAGAMGEIWCALKHLFRPSRWRMGITE